MRKEAITMSKYTTEVRYICEVSSGLGESVGYSNIGMVIKNCLPKVFDFYFPIFDENYRSVLETKILKHFYTREICEETVGLWKLRIDTKLNEIMPYYNKLYKSELLEFNPLYTVNLTRTTKTNLDSERNENEKLNDNTSTSRTIESEEEDVTSISGNNTGSETATSNNTNVDLYSDTPQGSLTGVENEKYLTNARKINEGNTAASATTNNISSTGNVTRTKSDTDDVTGSLNRTRDNTNTLASTENYLENVSGYEGKDASELLLKYRESFLNIDMMIINDLECLFFQLW
jgi:hypothetical protein